MKIVVLKSIGFWKLGYSSEVQNDALMHRQCLNGSNIVRSWSNI